MDPRENIRLFNFNFPDTLRAQAEAVRVQLHYTSLSNYIRDAIIFFNRHNIEQHQLDVPPYRD